MRWQEPRSKTCGVTLIQLRRQWTTLSPLIFSRMRCCKPFARRKHSLSWGQLGRILDLRLGKDWWRGMTLPQEAVDVPCFATFSILGRLERLKSLQPLWRFGKRALDSIWVQEEIGWLTTCSWWGDQDSGPRAPLPNRDRASFAAEISSALLATTTSGMSWWCTSKLDWPPGWRLSALSRSLPPMLAVQLPWRLVVLVKVEKMAKARKARERANLLESPKGKEESLVEREIRNATTVENQDTLRETAGQKVEGLLLLDKVVKDMVAKTRRTTRAPGRKGMESMGSLKELTVLRSRGKPNRWVWNTWNKFSQRPCTWWSYIIAPKDVLRSADVPVSDVMFMDVITMFLWRTLRVIKVL